MTESIEDMVEEDLMKAAEEHMRDVRVALKVVLGSIPKHLEVTQTGGKMLCGGRMIVFDERGKASFA